MTWYDVIQHIPVQKQGGDGNPAITDIVYDSRAVSTGAVFVAVPGFTVHGDRFIADAVAKGAAALVSENEQPAGSIPWIQVDNPRQILGALAKTLWQINFNDMITVGITGTNGKTTTAGFYHTLFQKVYSQDTSWLFSTITYILGDRSEEAVHTTPEASDLLRFIGTAAKKPEAITMEVSSHALDLHRVEGFVFDLTVWTNLSQDHLDFHHTMESYYLAKKKLFTQNLKPGGRAIINIDDHWGKRLSEELPQKPQLTYGFGETADVRITDSCTDWTKTEITVQFQKKTMRFSSALTGFFNVYNMAALTAGALARDISENEIQQCFDTVSVIPGRMEQVGVSPDFEVVVDYAHTPDALKNVLATAKKLTTGSVLCVFGCGGDRDRVKRPLMAEAVVQNSNEAVVTNDNPRTEDPDAIIKDILEGIPLDYPHHVITDRREAIKKALTLAQKGDCVIIAGKGHETYQEINGVRHHFDDREVVRELCTEMEHNSDNG